MKGLQLVGPDAAYPLGAPFVLSFVAGYVDSWTYLALFGTFVAQLTGSFVLSGALIVTTEPGAVAKQLAIPFFFLAGAAVTVLVHSLRECPRRALACCLGAEFVLLLGLFCACLAGTPFRGPDDSGAIVALLFGMTAMGAQSALVRLLARGGVSTNVMTTNTTLIAINTAEALLGWIAHKGAPASAGNRQSQARQELARLLPVAICFLLGTASGAVAYATIGSVSLLVPIFLVGSLALYYTGNK
jgi:uncharacterized membrane protein YoaK (UPF0700 family)